MPNEESYYLEFLLKIFHLKVEVFVCTVKCTHDNVGIKQ